MAQILDFILGKQVGKLGVELKKRIAVNNGKVENYKGMGVFLGKYKIHYNALLWEF